MFSIFKKKQPTKDEARFICVGVKFRKEIGILQEDLESCFEMAAKLKNKVYKIEDINKLNTILEFDTNDHYEWIELSLDNGDKTTSITGIYRFVDSKNISEDNIEKLFTSVLTSESYYTRVDIQNIAQKIGVDIFARNNFQYYSICSVIYNDNSSSKCITEPNKN